jgi:hypothetical protein
LAKSQQSTPTAKHVREAILEFPAAPASQLKPDEVKESSDIPHQHKKFLKKAKKLATVTKKKETCLNHIYCT